MPDGQGQHRFWWRGQSRRGSRLNRTGAAMLAVGATGFVVVLVFGGAAAAKRASTTDATVLSRTTVRLPVTQQTLDVTKVRDEATGQIEVVAHNAQGQVVDLNAAQAQEDAARGARYGKLDPALADSLNGLGPAKTTPVSIWLNIADPPTVRTGDLSADLAAVEGYIAAGRQGVLDELGQLGVQASVPRFGPAVFASLTPGQIRKLAHNPDVSTIYGPTENTTFQDDAATTERANFVWAIGNKGFGTSSRPAVHEDDGVSDINPFLNNATHPVIYYCSAIILPNCPLGKATNLEGGHASRVAGAIASTHPLIQGIAPSAQVILSENSQDLNSDSANVAANEWGRGNGADPTNMSWGQRCPNGGQNFMSRYVDWAEKNLAQTFTISAGNQDPLCPADFNVSAPGLAWGPITVGAFGDSNTGFWNDDFQSGFSRFVDPLTGQNKPEVEAVGQGLCLTNITGIDCGNAGTSFSAPQIAGQVTLMEARQPGQNQWPETNKAAVLASAYHDIIAGTGQDGLGGVVMNNSDSAYRNGQFFNNSFPAGATADIDHTVALVVGQRVKVAISWDSNSNPGGGTDVMNDDIDLHVLDPSNNLVCGGFSVANAWESCEFTAPVTGNYTFREHLFANPLPYATFIGMAWTIRSIPNICSAPARTFPAAGGSFFLSTINGPTYFDSYAGWGFIQNGREQPFGYVNAAPHNLTFADTNANIDLHALQFPSCAAQPIVPNVLANGFNSVTLVNAPAGVYWFVGDGFNGFVGTDNFSLTVAAPTSATSSVQSDSATPPTGR
jgi:Subtilase family